jgi:hypothetical protein
MVWIKGITTGVDYLTPEGIQQWAGKGVTFLQYFRRLHQQSQGRRR